MRLELRLKDRFLFTLLVLISCGGGSGGASVGTQTQPSLPVTPKTWIWGVTTDDPTVGTADQVAALSALPTKTVVRCVFDPPQPASYYQPSVQAIAAVADIMGQPVDSSEMASLTVSDVQARIADYLATMGSNVKIWEVGNEVNGNWLGSNVLPQITAMYTAAKAAGKATAMTFYYENPPTPGFDMLPWIDVNIPNGNGMRTGLDYVLVSYYEDENNGHQLTQAELDAVFSGLASRFPNSLVGFGEFGWGKSPPASDAIRADLLKRFWGYRVPTVPSYVGGGFYWQFRQTMVPYTLPDWAVLKALETK